MPPTRNPVEGVALAAALRSFVAFVVDDKRDQLHLLEDGAARTTIADALQHGRGRTSLFVADTGRLALFIAAAGPPLLISA